MHAPLKIRSVLLAFALATAACSTPGAAPTVSAPPVAANSADTGTNRVLELMAKVQVPGAQVASVTGERVVARSFGLANVAAKTPVTDDTIFEAASLSKPVFAYAVLRLVEAGKFDLDKPLDAYTKKPFIDDPRSGVVTARLVLSHRGGLPNFRPRGKPAAFAWDPGTRYSYSGEGIAWLQTAVEDATGEPLEALAKRLVFEPLGMAHSSYLFRGDGPWTKAWAYDAAGTPSPAARTREKATAVASLHTTAGDLGRFVAAIFGRRGLTEKTVLAMLEPVAAPSANCAICTGVADPGPPSRDVAWGLGFGLVRGDDRAFWQWGDNGLFKAYLFGDDAKKRGAIVMLNGVWGLAIAADLAALALADEPEAAREARVPLDWLKYGRYDDPLRTAFRDVLAGKSSAPLDALLADPAMDEDDRNEIGYALLRSGHVPPALAAFERNTRLHPESWNVWDSWGDGLAKAGRRDDAIAAYRRSLSLNPNNESGKNKLKELEGAGSSGVVRAP